MKQFKEGDWVRDARRGMKNPIVQLKSNCIALTNPKEYATQYELWQPKEGEWCWFWNRHTNISPLLRKFEYIFNGDFYTKDEMIFTHCEPFIGELPTFLQH